MSAMTTSTAFSFSCFMKNLMARMWRWTRIAAFGMARAVRFVVMTTVRTVLFCVVWSWNGLRGAFNSKDKS
jgi:hypothetical protein